MSTKTLSGIYEKAYTLHSPVTTLSIAASGYVFGGVITASTNTYTIVNQGSVVGIDDGIDVLGRGLVTNAGYVGATSTSTGAGVILGSGGTVTNDAGATIYGVYSGIEIGGASGTVDNLGSVTGGTDVGVLLLDGGSVSNGSATDLTATIRGETAVVSGLVGAFHNFGTVIAIGTLGVGGYFDAGGVATNGSSSDKSALIEATGAGFAFNAGAGTLDNYGTIRTTGTAIAGVVFEDGGVLTNGSAGDTTALIQSAGLGVAAEAGVTTVTNFGAIDAAYYRPSGVSSAVYLEGGGVVTNGSSKDRTAHLGGQVGAFITNSGGSFTNYGTVGGLGMEVGAALGDGGVIINGSSSDTSALIEAYAGVYAAHVLATIKNFGTIIAGGAPSTFAYDTAVLLEGGGVITNGSSIDTVATLKGGKFGVFATTIVATVTNFGDVSGSLAGVDLDDGGQVTNGSSSDTGATISGTTAGIYIATAAGAVANFGTIIGGTVSKYGVRLVAGGTVTNGSSADHVALIQGYDAVTGSAPLTVTNNGTITSGTAYGGIAVDLASGSRLTNEAGATITGWYAVLATASTVTNFGTVRSTGKDGVDLVGIPSRLNAEAGSVVVGTINAGFGTLDVVGGVATATAITSSAKIEGAGTLMLDGGTSYLEVDVSLTVAKIELSGTMTAVQVETKLGDSKVWDQTAGDLFIDTGDQMTFTGSGDTFTGTVSGTGTLLLSGGSDTLSNVAMQAGKMTISTAAVTLSGQVGITGTISATTTALTVAAGGVVLNGGGELLLTNSASNEIKGANASATLTNQDVIRGAGKLGGGSMSLVNSGTIESAYATALTIDTGADTIANSGVIEALAGGGVIIQSAVANTGTLASSNGTLTVDGAVTGTGIVHVFGGVVDFTSSFNEHVSFGSTGRLVLAHSTSFTSTVSSFSKTGTTSFDLQDINEATATASYSGTTASGILTVTDGTHTARIHLTGDYTASTWTLSADSGTGTIVVDPTKPPPHAAPLAQAMAGFGGGAGASITPDARPEPPPRLLAAHG